MSEAAKDKIVGIICAAILVLFVVAVGLRFAQGRYEKTWVVTPGADGQ